MKKYIPRLVDKVLDEELNAFGAVLITGPKWCGKTTTAKQKPKVKLIFKIKTIEIVIYKLQC